MPTDTATHPNILLLSGGSKVAIARISKQAAHKRGSTLHISDTTKHVPSRSIADHFSTLPEHTAPNWASELQNLCTSAKIGLIIPTRHSELLALSKAAATLRKNGTAAALSSKEALLTCIQKLDTFSFLKSIDAPTPETCLKRSFKNQLRFPLIAKPERGSSSMGLATIRNPEELESVPNDWILQETASGTEYTVNVYLSQCGEAICAIPHERIATESGEVVQAKTQRISTLMDLCKRIAEALPGATGIINIQAFVDRNSDSISIIEINPRIGGGYPLCDAAKGHYIEWLCREYLDKQEIEPFQNWTDNLLMMRYREALFSL